MSHSSSDSSPTLVSRPSESSAAPKMFVASGSTACDSTPHLQWKASGRRSRKSGCPNIFSGMNLQQLHRLFRGAGDRDAENRARLVWRGTEEDAEKGVEEVREVAGLTQALVGLRVRARNKAGFRVEGLVDHKRLKPSGYLRLVRQDTRWEMKYRQSFVLADIKLISETAFFLDTNVQRQKAVKVFLCDVTNGSYTLLMPRMQR